MENPHRRELIALLKKVAEKHGIHETFTTFLELSALSISNRFDTQHFLERKKRYLEIIGGFSKQEQICFAEMFSQLVLALRHEAQSDTFSDVLGTIYHELGLHNKWKAQFFTPMSVCDMMGRMTLGNPRYKEHISVLEPCVGSGAMVLGFVNAMVTEKLNWTKRLTVKGIDSDLKCVHMSYLQFSIYGIPAVIVHGNSITSEEWSHWYTPMYFIRL